MGFNEGWDYILSCVAMSIQLMFDRGGIRAVDSWQVTNFGYER